MSEILVPLKVLAHGEGLEMPSYATAGSAGCDLRAAIEAPLLILPGGRALVPTGLAVAIPEGYEGQVLAGAHRVLRQFHPKLFVEVHPELLIGYTTADVINIVSDLYKSIRYYDPNIRGVGKVYSRYALRPFPAVLRERDLSSRTDIFWMVCTN